MERSQFREVRAIVLGIDLPECRFQKIYGLFAFFILHCYFLLSAAEYRNSPNKLRQRPQLVAASDGGDHSGITGRILFASVDNVVEIDGDLE